MEKNSKHFFKEKYHCVIIIFIIILIVVLDIFLLNYKHNKTKKEQLLKDEEKNNISDDYKKILDEYYNAQISVCPNYTLKQSIDSLKNYENINVTIKRIQDNGDNEVHINIANPDDDMSGTLKLENGKIVITDATSTSLQNTEFESEINVYASYFIYSLLCG